ncbi:hypothetical protein ACHAWF_012012 [Thalassiosira exigua]
MNFTTRCPWMHRCDRGTCAVQSLRKGASASTSKVDKLLLAEQALQCGPMTQSTQKPRNLGARDACIAFVPPQAASNTHGRAADFRIQARGTTQQSKSSYFSTRVHSHVVFRHPLEPKLRSAAPPKPASPHVHAHTMKVAKSTLLIRLRLPCHGRPRRLRVRSRIRPERRRRRPRDSGPPRPKRAAGEQKSPREVRRDERDQGRGELHHHVRRRRAFLGGSRQSQSGPCQGGRIDQEERDLRGHQRLRRRHDPGGGDGPRFGAGHQGEVSFVLRSAFVWIFPLSFLRSARPRPILTRVFFSFDRFRQLLALFIQTVEEGTVVTTLTTWGLDRVDQRSLPLDNAYTTSAYPKQGAGATVFIIDTGAWADFDSVGNGQNGIDCNGHGSHCAGTALGNTYGVAPGAQLVGVRVLSCSGSESWSGVIAGVNYVKNDYADTGSEGISSSHGGRCIASMSLGGGFNSAVNTAVANLRAAGVPVAVAAGNDNRDAGN